MINDITTMKSVSLKDDAVIILDQTLLPNEEQYIILKTEKDIWNAIHQLKVRGAPAIGITAAFGLYCCASKICTDSFNVFLKEFLRIKNYLNSSRPTAVNLSAALNRMEKVVRDHHKDSVVDIKELLREESLAIREEDANACRQIGQNGLKLLRPRMGLLTHCNAGHLAVSEYGTALAPIYLGYEQNYEFKVFADETRPLLQGSRLTAYELSKAGVDVTLICDNMASFVMKKGWVQAVLVGCDRVAVNGDVANKIGTSGVAILASYYGIPFYVLGPSSSIDKKCPTGENIIIEERNQEEVTSLWYKKRMAPENIKVCNPAFDVTSHELITAIITEKGVFYPPYHFL